MTKHQALADLAAQRLANAADLRELGAALRALEVSSATVTGYMEQQGLRLTSDADITEYARRMARGEV